MLPIHVSYGPPAGRNPVPPHAALEDSAEMAMTIGFWEKLLVKAEPTELAGPSHEVFQLVGKECASCGACVGECRFLQQHRPDEITMAHMAGAGGHL